MLGWLFPPSCPCDPAAKAWAEERLRWLSREFDDHAFNGRRLVLPTPAFFPDPYDGSRRAVRVLLDRVCGYMDVDPDIVALKFVSDAGKLWLVNDAGQYLPHAAGTYEEGGGEHGFGQGGEGDADWEGETPAEPDAGGSMAASRSRQERIRDRRHEKGRDFTISIDTSGLGDSMALAGTFAHELAHVRLLGEGRLTGTEYDNELLTDLTVVFFGLGILLANSPRTWDSQYTKWPGTSLNKPEYMTTPMFGYALAHLAWFRGEDKPAWTKYLHWNARPDFKQGLRFLFKTGNSLFRPKRWQCKATS
jgi:hypothetical protein